MEQPAPRTVDDEGLPRPPAVRGKLPRALVKFLTHGENTMFLAVAVARLEGGGFQLQPFLVMASSRRPGTSSRLAPSCRWSAARHRSPPR
jgi:hypothetical protein